MDVNRYYVSPDARKSFNLQGKKDAVNGTLQRPVKLPTPQAFFERQQQAKEADQKAMLKFASRRTAKHNLHVRYDDLKHAREDVVEELNVKITGQKPKGKPKLFETEQEYLERTKERASKQSEGLKPGVNSFYLNELEDALVEDDEYKINRSILVAFFEQYAVDRIKDVDALLHKYKGEEFTLFKNLADEFRIKVDKKKNKKGPVEEPIKPMPSKRDLRPILKHEPEMIELETEKAEKLASVATAAVVVVNSSKPKYNLQKQNSFESKRSTVSVNTKSPGPVIAQNPSLVGVTPMVALPTSPMSPTASRFKRQNPEVASLRSESSVSRNGSVTSLSTTEPVTEEMRQFQKALDEEIKGKLNTGEYVISIMERGGRWWVNRDVPKVHPSQRRRNTLLDQLRAGSVPISNEEFNKGSKATVSANAVKADL